MLKIGWSKKDISIEGPIGITGQFYQRISKGILDPNTLTALVIEGDDDMTIMVSADLVGLGDGIVEDIRDAIKESRPDFPAEKLLMNATHTHTSPRYDRQGHARYDLAPSDNVEMIPPEVYREFLIKQTRDAVLEAYDNREEGAYAYGSDFAVVAHHRRPTYFDDLRLRPGNKIPPSLAVDKHAKMYGGTNDEMFSEYEGYVDSTAQFLFTFDKCDRLTGAIVNVPCPSQNSESESVLSASYWAEFRKLVAEKYGNIYILPQCAAAGDMAPRALHNFLAQDRRFKLRWGDEKIENVQNMYEIFMRREVAERIMEAFNRVYSWAPKEMIRDAKVEHRVEKLSLDAWKITKDQYESAKLERDEYAKLGFITHEDKYGEYKNNTQRSSVITRYEAIMERYEDDLDTRDAEVHVVRIGDVAFASNPFELYVAYQHRIQARSPFTQTFIVQLAASIDAAGYLCTERAAENMGYSANIYSCAVSPKGGTQLVEQTLRILKEMH